MENIERFNLYTVHILSTLYGEFPVARGIEVEDVVDALKAVIPFNDANERSKLGNFVGHTIIWLEQTGYLLSPGSPTDVGRKFVLSPKAFEAMAAQLPASLKQKPDEPIETLGDKLTHVSKDFGSSVASEAKKQVAGQLVGLVIGHAMKVFTS